MSGVDAKNKHLKSDVGAGNRCGGDTGVGCKPGAKEKIRFSD